MTFQVPDLEGLFFLPPFPAKRQYIPQYSTQAYEEEIDELERDIVDH